MLKIGMSIVVFVFLCTGTIAAQSLDINNPPAKQNAVKANDIKKNPEDQKQIFTTSPAIINPTPPPPLQEIRDKEQCKYSKKDDASWWNFTLTDVLLALFTLGLVIVGWFQVCILKGSLKVAIIAADAAKESADAAIENTIALKDAERAHIYVVIERHTFTTRIEPSGTSRGNIEAGYNEAKITVRNFGRTPAIIIKINYKLGIFSNTEIDKNLSEMKTKPSKIPSEIIIVTQDKEWGQTADCDISPQDADNIGISSQYIYACFGRIDYRDVFGTIHKMTFCWEDNGLFFIPDEKRCKHT